MKRLYIITLFSFSFLVTHLFGLTDATTVHTQANESNKSTPLKESTLQIYSESENENEHPKHNNRLSKYTQSDLLLKADKAYKNGDDVTAMIYYEMLVDAGYATRKLKNNLCYLYGKQGAWAETQKLLQDEKYISQLLYAYAYGAVESHQELFIKHISEYMMLDRSGKLLLLTASYYEQKQEMQRAFSYYKMAYKKNPSDFYTLFAYARSLDIQKKYTQAKVFYKKALLQQTQNRALQKIIQTRIIQLQE